MLTHAHNIKQFRTFEPLREGGATTLHFLAIQAEAIAILSPYNYKAKQVRIHSGLTWRSGSWIRLWYFLRGLDSKGRGRVDVPMCLIETSLRTRPSTIYGWLRDGHKKGGFRRYIVRKGFLRVYLGGLHRLCRSLGIEDLGTVSVVELEEVSRLKDIKWEAAGASADRGQSASIHKQRLKLSEAERKHYKPVFPEDIFNRIDGGSSVKPDRGKIPGVVSIGPEKLFVDAGFLPFGKSQKSLADELGVSVDTVQRHLRGKDRRQICQHKSAYRTINALFEYGDTNVPRRELTHRTHYRIDSEGVGILEEPCGQSSINTSTVIRRGRVFEYKGRHWLYRCNVYRPTAKLTSMSRFRSKLRWLFKLWKEPKN